MFWHRITYDDWLKEATDPYEVGLAIVAFASFNNRDAMESASDFSDLSAKKKLAWLRAARQVKRHVERKATFEQQSTA
jgi:hypothetical protein